MINEFTLIDRYFSSVGSASVGGARDSKDGVNVGVGDDAAVVMPTAGMQLVAATDTLVAGVHFPEEASPEDIATRCLRVNLSDMAAMGAKPKWFLLALTLPESDPVWLAGFSAGLSQDAQAFGCRLIGGDTTRGPLTISLTLLGEVPTGKALLRSAAKPGDRVFVSGCLGSAAAALDFLSLPVCSLAPWQQQALDHYHRPEPQIELGFLLRSFASAAIDVSDGLLADLGHIAKASDVVIEILFDQLPVADALLEHLPADKLQQCVLTGGDDYQLCFTVPESRVAEFQVLLQRQQLSASLVGRVMAADEHKEKDKTGVVCLDSRGLPIQSAVTGYQHF